MVKNLLKKILWVVVLTVVLLGVPKLSGVVASFFNYQALDPDGAFAWISVHHIVQALVFLLIMAGLSRYKRIDFGFSLGNKAVGMTYLLKFTLIFGVGSVVSHLITLVTNSFQVFPYAMTARNIIGQLSFQLLLSGPSEELIFRAFAITMLGLLINHRVLSGKVSSANLIAAVIFGLAHVGITFMPFALRYHPYQILMSIVLGYFYGDCYEKSKSIVYPMLMHSVSNVIMVGLTVIATFILY